MAEPTLADDLEKYEFEGFACCYNSAARSMHPVQSHRQVEVIVPFERSSATATWTAQEKQYQVSLAFGQICIVAPNQQHQINLEEPSDIMLIHLPVEVITEAAQEALRSPRWELTGGQAVSDETVISLAKELRSRLTQKDAIASLYRRALIRLLSVHIIAKYAQVSFPDTQTAQGNPVLIHNPKLSPVVRYIKDNLDKNLKVRTLAEIAGLSQSHFSRMFKRSIGVTPHQYILSQRIHLAETLLRDPNISLSEISFRCGFYDQSHFVLQFRRFVGTTPKSYREQKVYEDQRLQEEQKIYAEQRSYEEQGASPKYEEAYRYEEEYREKSGYL